MSEVYIDELKITNFGPYFGEHIFDFKVCDDKRVILIGGRNGAGKTHLLRAIYIAIVGQRGVSDLRTIEAGSGATRFDVKESLNRFAKSKGYDTSELCITLRIQDKTGSISKKIAISRKIRHRPKSNPEFSSIVSEIEDDKPNKNYKDDSELVSVIDNYLTRELARFFFFDAEKGQSIKLEEPDIVDAISRTLGLSTYEQLEKDLSKLSDDLRHNTKQLSENKRKRIEVRTKKEMYDGKLESLKQEYRENTRNIEDLKFELEDIDNELSALGVVDPQKIETVNRQREELTELLGKLKQQLKNAWEKEIPLMVLGNYANELANYLVSEERRREWENRKSAVEPRIPQVKQDVFANVPPQFDLGSDSRAFYEKRLHEALQRIFDPAPQGMSEKIFVVFESNERSQKIRSVLENKKNTNIKDICDNYELKLLEKKELDTQLTSFQQHETNRKQCDKSLQRKGEIFAEIKRLESTQSENNNQRREIEDKLPELKKEENKLEDEIDKQKKERDLGDLATCYKNVARRIKENAAEKLRDKISEIVSELWLDITDRNMEFKSLVFNKYWNCFLIKYNGDEITWDSINTSAGQKQVRLLAFVEALRRLSQKNPPLVVDTPLGRLDKDVKQNVLERLYMKGHQTLLFSTDAEIDQESPLFKMIEGRIARVYTLNTEGHSDDHSYRVRVSEDYFKRVL